MTKRGKLEIMRDILKTVQDNHNSIKPTQLLRKSMISSSRFKEYYLDLLAKGLVIEIKTPKDEKFVSLTEKGFTFIERYKTIINFIEEFDL